MLMNIAAMAMANPGILGGSTPSAGTPNSTGANGTEAASSTTPVVDEQLSALVGGVSSPVLGWLLRYLHIDPKLLIPILGTISFLTFAWQYIERYVLSQLDWFMCTVELRPEDEIYAVMSSWIAAQPFSQKSKSFVVTSSSFNTRRLWDPCWWWDEEKEDEEDIKEKRSLFFTPAPGNHYFWYQRRLLVFRRHCNREGAGYMSATERESMSISCFGRDPWALKKLLHDAYTEYNGKEDDKTLIYRGVMKHSWGVASWQKSISKASRPFDTVILNQNLKDEIVGDIQDYLKPATRRWYSNRGIPYRRGYLLHGPPGTGKSSLSLALAGYFNMRIYIVSLSSAVANEENLSSLFAELPRKCMVLLEDIDTAGLTHTRENDDDDRDNDNDGDGDDSRRGHSRRKKGPEGSLSLSGLLNILDGVASQEGRILIMTTNHVDKLDKALIRPGRVDLQIKFSLADNEITTSIFKSMYGNFENEQPNSQARKRPPIGQPGAFGSDSESESEPEDVKQKREAEIKARAEKHKVRITKLADQFAKKVPEGKFSPAELQGFLLRHKCTPEKAIEGVEQWCVDTLKEREEKEKKEAEEKKKKEEKRLLRKEKRRLREEKKLKKIRERNNSSDGSDSDSDASNSDSCSDSDDGKPVGSKSKNARARKKAGNDSDSESVSDASSSEEEARRKKQKKSKAKRRRRKVDSDSDSCGSSSEEETKKKRKSKTKARSKKKSQKEKSATDESKAKPKSEPSDLGAVESEAKKPEVAVEEVGGDNKSQDLAGAEVGSNDKGLLSPLKDSLKVEPDSGYETPSEEGSVSGRHVSAPSDSPSPLQQSEVEA